MPYSLEPWEMNWDTGVQPAAAGKPASTPAAGPVNTPAPAQKPGLGMGDVNPWEMNWDTKKTQPEAPVEEESEALKGFKVGQSVIPYGIGRTIEYAEKLTGTKIPSPAEKLWKLTHPEEVAKEEEADRKFQEARKLQAARKGLPEPAPIAEAEPSLGETTARHWKGVIEKNAPAVQSIFDIENTADFRKWATWNTSMMAGLVLEVLPFTPELKGAAGAVNIGKGVLSRYLTASAAERAAAPEVAGGFKAIGDLIKANPGAASQFGTFLKDWMKLKPMMAPIALAEAGEILGGQIERQETEGVALDPVRALASVFVATKLEELGAEGTMRRLMSGVGGATASRLKNAGIAALSTGAGESVEEFFQTYAEQFGVKPDDMGTFQTFLDAVNGAAAGFVGGFAMGGPAGAMSRTNQSDQTAKDIQSQLNDLGPEINSAINDVPTVDPENAIAPEETTAELLAAESGEEGRIPPDILAYNKEQELNRQARQAEAFVPGEEVAPPPLPSEIRPEEAGYAYGGIPTGASLEETPKQVQEAIRKREIQKEVDKLKAQGATDIGGLQNLADDLSRIIPFESTPPTVPIMEGGVRAEVAPPPPPPKPKKQTQAEIKALEKAKKIEARKQNIRDLRKDLSVDLNDDELDLTLGMMKSSLQAGTKGGKVGTTLDGQDVYAKTGYEDWYPTLIDKYNNPKTSPTGKNESLKKEDIISSINAAEQGKKLGNRQKHIIADVIQIAGKLANSTYSGIVGDLNLAKLGITKEQNEKITLTALEREQSIDEVNKIAKEKNLPPDQVAAEIDRMNRFYDELLKDYGLYDAHVQIEENKEKERAAVEAIKVTPPAAPVAPAAQAVPVAPAAQNVPPVPVNVPVVPQNVPPVPATVTPAAPITPASSIQITEISPFKRSADFSQTGEYEFTVNGEKWKAFKDSGELGAWYAAKETEDFPKHSAIYTKDELIKEIKSGAFEQGSADFRPTPKTGKVVAVPAPPVSTIAKGKPERVQQIMDTEKDPATIINKVADVVSGGIQAKKGSAEESLRKTLDDFYAIEYEGPNQKAVKEAMPGVIKEIKAYLKENTITEKPVVAAKPEPVKKSTKKTTPPPEISNDVKTSGDYFRMLGYDFTVEDERSHGPIEIFKNKNEQKLEDNNTSFEKLMNEWKEIKKARGVASIKLTMTSVKAGKLGLGKVTSIVEKLTTFIKHPPNIYVIPSIKDFIATDTTAAQTIKAYMEAHDMLDENGDNLDVGGFNLFGEVYIVANAQENATDVTKTFLHELTHNGLNSFFSSSRGGAGVGSIRLKYDLLMDKIWQAHSKAITEIAKKTHTNLDLSTIEGRRALSEEWLCNQTYNTQMKWYDKLVAIFKDLLRALKIDVKISDSEIRTVLRDAFRQFGERVVDGKAEPQFSNAGQDARYLELAKDPEKNKAELQKMVDAAAKAAGYKVGPMYHGTKSKPFTEFKHNFLNDAERVDIGFHFGTKEQATYRVKGDAKRMPDDARIGKYYLSTGRLFTLGDMGSFYPDDIAEILIERLGAPKTLLTSIDKLMDKVGGNVIGQGRDLQSEPLNQAYELLRQELEADGYNGIRYENEVEGKGESIAVFRSSQIKSADPVTYDDQGNVIPLSKRFNPEQADIRFSVGVPNSFIENALAPAIDMFNNPSTIPEADMNKIRNAASMVSAGKWAMVRQLLSLPYQNSKKYADWKRIWDIFIHRVEERSRITSEVFTVAHDFFSRDKILKQMGYTRKQIADFSFRNGRILTLGDDYLRDIVLNYQKQSTNDELTQEQKDRAKEKYDWYVKNRAYSFEDLQKGIKDYDGTIIKLNNETEYKIYRSVRASVDDLFRKMLHHLEAMTFRSYRGKKWYKILATALNTETLTDEQLRNVVGGGLNKAAITKLRKIGVNMNKVWDRISAEMDKVSPEELKSVDKTYSRLSNTIKDALTDLTKHLSEETGITDKQQLEELSRELLSAYAMTRPQLKKIKTLRNDVNSWIGFFPRYRKSGNFRATLIEHVVDPDTGTVIENKVKEHFMGMYDNERQGVKITKQIVDKYGVNGVLPENYEIVYAPVTRTPEGAFQGVNDINTQKVIDDALANMNDKGKFYDEEGKQIDIAEKLWGSVYESIAGQMQSRGVAAHFIKRKQDVGERAIKGYEEENHDKILLQYIASMSGLMTKQQASLEAMNAMANHMTASGEMVKGLEDPSLFEELNMYIKGQLRNDTAMDRGSAHIRSFMFTWYLGAMIKSAAVNGTQPIVVGIPELAKYMRRYKVGGAFKANKVQLKASLDVATGNMNEMEIRSQQFLSNNGTTQDQYIKQIRESTRSDIGKVSTAIMDAIAYPFSQIEQYNRKSSGLAMFRTAYKMYTGQGMSSEDAFNAANQDAVNYINDVHFPLGRHNVPLMATTGDISGTAIRTLYTFRTYTHNFLLNQYNLIRSSGKTKEEAWNDMRTFIHTMAYLAMFGGLLAMPFLKDIFEWFEKNYGYSPTTKVRKILRGIGGETLEKVGMTGIPSALGANISGSLFIGVPFLGETPVDTVYGVYGGQMTKMKRAFEAFKNGDVSRVGQNILPEFIRGPMVAAEQSRIGRDLFNTTGYATTPTGKPVYDKQGNILSLTTGQAAIRSIGFQPTDVSIETEETYRIKRLTAWVDGKKASIAAQYRIDKSNHDPDAQKNMIEKVRSLREQIKDRGLEKLVSPVTVGKIIAASKEAKTKRQKREQAFKRSNM